MFFFPVSHNVFLPSNHRSSLGSKRSFLAIVLSSCHGYLLIRILFFFVKRHIWSHRHTESNIFWLKSPWSFFTWSLHLLPWIPLSSSPSSFESMRSFCLIKAPFSLYFIVHQTVTMIYLRFWKTWSDMYCFSYTFFPIFFLCYLLWSEASDSRITNR